MLECDERKTDRQQLALQQNFQRGLGSEKTLLVKCCLYKHEVLTLSGQNPRRKSDVADVSWHTYNPEAVGVETGGSF